MPEKMTRQQFDVEVINSWKRVDVKTKEMLKEVGISAFGVRLNNFIGFLPVKGGMYRYTKDTKIPPGPEYDELRKLGQRKQEITEAVDKIIAEKGYDFSDVRNQSVKEIYENKMEEIADIYIKLINMGFTRTELCR